MTKTNNIKSIYFIGIGGVGMSGIAQVAFEQGLEVSGSDLRQSYMTDSLVKNGINVLIGQKASNLDALKKVPDIVVVSTAILQNNPELIRAKELNCEIWHRAQMLAYLGRDLDTLAVCGTHGKTSTSSMLATVMDDIGQDPTFLIGGVVRQYGSNARCGNGKHYVVEADESDKSFRYLSPASAIVTNIEADHLDHYQDLDEIYEKFTDFIASIKKDGIAVVCGDDKKLVDIAKKATKNVVSYGFDSSNDCVISDYKVSGIGCKFKLTLPVFKVSKSKRKSAVDIECSLPQNPGKHYASNASAVIVLLDYLGFDPNKAAESLSHFKGIKRRFDLIGKANDITVVDDYAHHSTEIAATVKAAVALGFNQVHVIWQPHRYSRVKLLCEIYREEFGHAFDGVDTVAFTDVYAAGETPVPGVSGKTFLRPLQDAQAEARENDEQFPKLSFLPNRYDIVPYIKKVAKPGDLVITMGAGDISSKAPAMVEEFQEIENSNNSEKSTKN